MPITITTADLETYTLGNTLAQESMDGNGLALYEALEYLADTGIDDTIIFDAPLLGSTIQIGNTFIRSNVIIDGDVDNNGSADITILMQEDTITIDTAGASLNLDNVNLDFSSTASFFRDGAINITADNVTVTNSGTLTSAGGPSSFSSDRAIGVQTTADDFTLINEAGGVIDSAGRHGVEAGTTSNQNGFFIAANINITNHGLIEGEDDGVRMGSGTVTNTGTIRGTGGYDLNTGNPDSLPGITSDGITALHLICRLVLSCPPMA